MTQSYDPRWLEDKCEVILDTLKRREPSKNEVFATHDTETKIIYEHQDFSLSSSLTETVFGTRCIVGGSQGFLTTNSSNPDRLKQIAGEVQSLAKLSPPSPHHGIGPGETAPVSMNLDPKLANLPIRDLFSMAELMIAEARKDSRVAIDRAEMSLKTTLWTVANSNGLRKSSYQTTASWVVMGMAKTETEVTSFDYDGATVGNHAQLEREVISSTGRFRDSVVSSLGAGQGPTYKGAVLLHPNAVAELLLGYIFTQCSGLAQQEGISSWKEKMGELVAHPELSVFEDPLDASRPDGWSTFDREGVATARHDILREGRMSFTSHNCFSANRGGVKPTGNASGGATGLPGISFSNVGVASRPGKSLEAMIKSMGNRTLFLKRFSGNNDSVSGLFSGVAKNSRQIENGALGGAVQNVMVSGNAAELIKNIVAIGEESVTVLGGLKLPYMIVDGVSVTGS